MLLLQAFHSIRSGCQLVERIGFDLLWPRMADTIGSLLASSGKGISIN
jgi:hypothetical protein